MSQSVCSTGLRWLWLVVVVLIAAGLGIGILPLASVAEALESRSLWNLARPEDLLGADLYFISNPAMQLSAAEEAFLRLFEQRLSATEEEPAAETAEALLSDPPAP